MRPLRKFSSLIALAMVATAGLLALAAEELPPSLFEEFALRPGASVIWSQTVGQIDSRDAHATVTALAVKNESAPEQVMRGVRINLTHASPAVTCDWRYTAWNILCRRPNAAVYIEAARLREVQEKLLRGAVDLRPFEFISEYGVWPRTSASGLIICGYDFAGMKGADLARLFAVAHKALHSAFAETKTGIQAQ